MASSLSSWLLLLLLVLHKRLAWGKAALVVSYANLGLMAPHTRLRFICIYCGLLVLKGDSNLDFFFPLSREGWVPFFLLLLDCAGFCLLWKSMCM